MSMIISLVSDRGTSIYRPCHVMSCHVMSCHVMSYRVRSYRVVSHRMLFCNALSLRVISCHIILYRIGSCYVLSHGIVLKFFISLPYQVQRYESVTLVEKLVEQVSVRYTPPVVLVHSINHSSI